MRRASHGVPVLVFEMGSGLALLQGFQTAARPFFSPLANAGAWLKFGRAYAAAPEPVHAGDGCCFWGIGNTGFILGNSDKGRGGRSTCMWS